MHFTRNQLADLRRTLNDARQEAIDSGHYVHSCKVKYLDPLTGQDFRLEHKPRGRRFVLQKHGFEIVDGIQSSDGIGTVTPKEGFYVKIPLGEHGIDHLAVDPETGDIFCALCRESETR